MNAISTHNSLHPMQWVAAVAVTVFAVVGIGAITGVAIGGAFAGIGRRRDRSMADFDDKDGFSAIQDEQARNYWLDHGRLTPSPGLPHSDDNDPQSHEP